MKIALLPPGARSPRGAAAVGLLLAAGPSCVLAQTAAAPSTTPTSATALPLPSSPPAGPAGRPLWELGGGAGVLHLPHYRGSDQAHTWVVPVPYVVYRGDIFKADRSGARAVLYESTRLDFDLSAGASAPTRSKDNDARRGMADLPPTVELGPNLNFTVARGANWKLDLRAPVRWAVSVERRPQSVGVLATPNINLDLRPGGGWNLGLQAAAVVADRRFNAHFYEVTAQDAAPGRPAYRARAGYGGVQAIGALSRRQGRLWTGAFVKYDDLAGAVFADSPLVRERRQWSAGVAVSWIFATSSRTVPVSD